ncbi:TRAP transporter large permease [Halobacillus shinanisalinarum]|uniref:TRAP transporter large permease n=1 Tax=Halobacillus shinanisalinarum TaxID=2932258 RepID=A0ABY4GYI1_9BACI|nr:TRAP transporter large permease [Halobacillus shinanisalinarum]UOQ91837.1 TRAP transporter large permease [Halobacillus shinanisalinarum]
MDVIIPVLLLFLFLAFGVPVAIAMGVAGAVGLYMAGGVDSLLGIFQTAPYSSVASYGWVVAPMFILMAEFLSASKIINDLFKSAHKWLGHIPGGLAVATIFASGLMGALSGSSTASAATISSSAVPQMKKFGYNPKLAMGVVSIGGTLSILIPPSTILIIYGIITESSIDKLFIAGILPGIITALGFCVVILLWAFIKSEDAPRISPVPFIERIRSLRLLWPILLLLSLVLIGIYMGIVTITEAAGLAAVGSFIIPLVMGKFTFSSFNQALNNSLKTTTMIFTIIIAGHIYGYYLTITQITQKLVNFVAVLDVSKWTIMLFIVLLYLILGFFMDQIAILLLTLPLTFPVAMSLGFNPIWFGIVVAKTAEIGLVTPPLGLNIFVSSGAAKEDIGIAFKGIIPFVLVDVVILLLLIFLPAISMYLPNQM